MKLWGGRFHKNTDPLVEAFTASIHFDQRLAQIDIVGSLAHVKMLGKCAILSEKEVTTISNGLTKLAKKITNNNVQFNLADEDIHMNIERLLTQDIGDVAGKLHSGRSRNDQVALDLHLYLRQQLLIIVEKINQLQVALIQQATTHVDTILPGYTHLQRAQPVNLAHHLLAYVAMLQRDSERFMASWPRINTMPLGAGALAGSSLAIDRDYVAQLLHFDSLYENSMDAVSDRDFIVEFIAHASLLMMHLSKLSEEFILWSSQEFSFIELDDAYCTGSSMMPQKKNPDIAELVRGKTGRVYGALMAILTMLKGLPLAYNRDMQEDKEGLFDTLKTVNDSLSLYTGMISTMKVNTETMATAAEKDFSNATQLADYLVEKDVPFREAHAIIGNIVAHCIKQKILLADLGIEQYQQFHPQFNHSIYQLLTAEYIVNARQVKGSTGKDPINQQIQSANAKLVTTKTWLEQQKFKVEISAFS